MAPGPGPEAGLLLELARRGVVRVLRSARDRVRIEPARRDLPERATRRDAPLPDEDDAIRVVDRDDRDGARVTGDVALVARAVGPLDRVDPELEVAPTVEDARIDDPLDELVVGRAEGFAGGVDRTGVAGPVRRLRQAATVSRSEVRLTPLSASNRWSFE